MTTSMSRSTLPPSVDDMWTSSNGKDLKQVRLVSHVAMPWGGGGGVAGILTVDSHNSTMCNTLIAALSNNVSVVSFNFIGGPCLPTHVLTLQNDYQLWYGQAGA